MHLSLFPSLDTLGDRPLRVYLLGQVGFEQALALQRALVYEISGDRDAVALVLCEHPPLITVGRQGGPGQLRLAPDDLRARRLPVRWVNRGGGCLLHGPGQLAIYPILALDRHGLGLGAYLDRLREVLIGLLDDFSVVAEARPDDAGVWSGARLIAEVGVAVRDWVTYHGAFLNINPNLTAFTVVQNRPGDLVPMTSLERQRHGPLRPALVRERLIERFCAAFACQRTAVFFSHPLLGQRARPTALAWA